MKYIVRFERIYSQLVEANSEEEAIEKAGDASNYCCDETTEPEAELEENQ